MKNRLLEQPYDLWNKRHFWNKAVIVGILYLFECYGDYEDVKNKHDKLFTKKVIVKHTQILLAVTTAVFWVIISVNLLYSYNVWAAQHYLADSFGYKALPLIFAALIIAVISAIVVFGLKPFWKFNTDEKDYKKKQLEIRKEIWNNKIQRFPKLLRYVLKWSN